MSLISLSFIKLFTASATNDSGVGVEDMSFDLDFFFFTVNPESSMERWQMQMNALTRACSYSGSFRQSAMCDLSPFSFSQSSKGCKSDSAKKLISLDELEGAGFNSGIFLSTGASARASTDRPKND